VALEKVVALLSLLPTPQGETPWPRVPEPGQEEEGLLTLRLAPGPVALGPLTLTLSHAGGTWYLGLEGEDHPLEDTLVLPWEDLEVWAVRENDLLHLRLEARSGLRLYELLAEGRLLAYLLHPGKDYAYLRLLRGLSTRLKGEFQAQAFGPALAEKYRKAPEEALQDFARKGLELTLKRLGQADPLPLLQEVGQALGLEAEAQTLGQALREYLGRRPPTRETLGGEVHFLALTPEPQALKLDQHVLSVRLKEDAVYLGQAGEVPRRLKDLLVYRLGERALVLAREGRRLAYTLLPLP